MNDRRFLPRRAEPPAGDLDPRLEAVRELALARTGVTEEFPFGPEVMVFKVGGKIFAAMAWEESPLRLSLRCAEERVEALREAHAAIGPPRYFDRKRWNQVTLDETIDPALLAELVDQSYTLIRASLPRKVREALDAGS